MALPLTGTIRWEVSPLYPGVTPVSIKHYNEVLNYIENAVGVNKNEYITESELLNSCKED